MEASSGCCCRSPKRSRETSMSQVRYFKICPGCQTHAALQASFCPTCGHRFRTQFVDPTLVVPAPRTTYRVRRPSALGIAVGLVLALLLAVTNPTEDDLARYMVEMIRHDRDPS